jgi:hypothetical protein
LKSSSLKRRPQTAVKRRDVEIRVPVSTLDALLPRMPRSARVSFLKLDLEGSEYDALSGGARLLRKHRPWCLFENRLAADAEGYSQREFFGLFRRLGYTLFDVLGNRVDPSLWKVPGPWIFAMVPREEQPSASALLAAVALELTLEKVFEQAAGLPLDGFAKASASEVRGFVDVNVLHHFVRVTGWAVDAASGAPARSVVIAVNGEPVRRLKPGLYRHDVVAAMRNPDVGPCGFDAQVPVPPATPSLAVEVFAEGAAGFSQLRGP